MRNGHSMVVIHDDVWRLKTSISYSLAMKAKFPISITSTMSSDVGELPIRIVP